MKNDINKKKLLVALREARSQWDALLAEVGNHRLTEPSVVEGWSVKDIIAHITWYERETVGILQAKALVGSSLWELPQDQRNIPIYEKNKHRTLEEVLTESELVYQQLLDSIRALSEEDLLEPTRFQNMPTEWLPWKVIAGNSFEHYHQHLTDIRQWLERTD